MMMTPEDRDQLDHSDLPLKLCEMCRGNGRVPVGKLFVTPDMASDAGEPAMVGMSMGLEYGPCPACDGDGRVPVEVA